MKSWVTRNLACPSCHGDLELQVFSNRGQQDGIFTCISCTEHYFLIDDIPRFVDQTVLEGSESYHKYVAEYRDELSEFGIEASNRSRLSERVEEKTEKYFGYEWDRFKNWGWMEEEEVSDEEKIKYESGFLSDSKRDFENKSLMEPDELDGDRLILDAGCGNGRFSNQAANYGGDVIGVDLGTPTVEAAHDNCDDLENVQIVQGNLFNLPFKIESFDTIFSIGVLQHTGDAEGAFNSLVDHLRPAGVITAHVYHKLNPIWEFNNTLLRSITTRLSVKQNMIFAKIMANLARILAKVKLRGRANYIFRVQPTVIQMYDWYSAPVASHHTYGEVENWFLENEMVIVDTAKDEDYGSNWFNKPWVATVKGKKMDE